MVEIISKGSHQSLNLTVYRQVLSTSWTQIDFSMDLIARPFKVNSVTGKIPGE